MEYVRNVFFGAVFLRTAANADGTHPNPCNGRKQKTVKVIGARAKPYGLEFLNTIGAENSKPSTRKKGETMKTQDKSKLGELQKALEKNERKAKRLRKTLESLQEEKFRLWRAIHREEIKSLLGKPVKRKYRSSDNQELNAAVGTLTEVKRTWCKVDFGELGIWNFPIDSVAPAEAEQGMEVTLKP